MTTFIREYSPSSLSDFKFHENIIPSLQSFIHDDSICKRILICGDSSSGKSTILNCITNDISNTYEIFDLYTICDENIEEFRQNLVHFCKMISAKEKLIIMDNIDELKSIFQDIISYVLDTYSIHIIATCLQVIKVVDTIQSRLHIIHIPIFPHKSLIQLIKTICSEKKIQLEDDKDSNTLIMQLSNYSIRMIYSNLEKLYYIFDHVITKDDIYKVCCILSHKHLIEFTEACFKYKDIKSVCNLLHSILHYGYSVIDFLEQYLLFIKYHSLDYIDEKKTCCIVHILSKYIILFHSVHENEIELFLFSYELIHI